MDQKTVKYGPENGQKWIKHDPESQKWAQNGEK